MASSLLQFPFTTTTTTYRVGALFTFKIYQLALLHPVLLLILVLYFHNKYSPSVLIMITTNNNKFKLCVFQRESFSSAYINKFSLIELFSFVCEDKINVFPCFGKLL